MTSPDLARAESSSAPLYLILLLGALAALAPFSIDLYLPAFPTLKAHFGCDEAAVQSTLSAYFAGLAAGQLVVGPLSDRFGRITPLLIGLALYALASVGCALAPSIGALAGFRLLQALGACAGMVVSRAMLRDLYAPREMARVLSMIILVMGIAPIIAPMAGSAILGTLGWEYMFVALALYGVFLLIAIRAGLGETLKEPGEPLKLRPLMHGYWETLRNRRFLSYTLAGGAAQAALFAYIASSSFVFTDVYHLSPTQYSLLFGCNAAGLIAASQFNAQLLKRHSPEHILPYALGFFAAAGCVFVLMVKTGLGGFWGAALPLFFVVASLGLGAPNTVAAAMAAVSKRAGLASALLGSLQFGIAGLSSYLTGLFFDGTALPLAMMVCGCGLLSLALIFLMVPRHEALPEPA